MLFSRRGAAARGGGAAAPAGPAATPTPPAAAAASASSHITAATTAPSQARTRVWEYSTPPDVLAAKRKQLQHVGPAGWRRLLAYAAIAPPLWLANALQLLASNVLRPQRLLAAPDPSAFALQPLPFALHEEFITVGDGVRLHAVSPGRRPDKPLMLMLHGFPESSYSWRHQMAAFAAEWDVVALDMRGYATSDKPKDVAAYSLARLATDVQDAIAALGHSDATLLAHDWGGAVAWVAAGMFGSDVIRRLVIMAAPHMGVASTNMSSDQYLKSLYILAFQAPLLPEATLLAGNAEALVGAFTQPPAGCRNQEALRPGDVDYFRASFCQPGAASGGLNYYRALLRWQLFADPADPAWRALRSQLDMPVLVLWGGADFALGVPLLAGTEAVAPRCTINVLDGCSHWVQQDYPAQVTELVEAWLAEVA